MAQVIPVPGNISESSTGLSTLIVFRWNRGRAVSPFISLFWILIVFFVVYSVSGISRASSLVERIQEIGIVPKVYLLYPSLVAAFVGYGLLIQFHNRTEILITGSDMKISIRPIPAWGNKTIQKSEISQLFVREKYNYTRNEVGPSTRTTYYELHWIDTHKNGRLLVGKLLDQEALYLEKRLEKILGVTDQSVKGEFLA